MKLLSYFKYYLWYFGHFKVPLIGHLKPKLVRVTDEDVLVKLPLSRRSKNHLNSMYFGALAVGADLAGGLHALYYAKRLNIPISFAFKSFDAQFLKRPESDVYFVSTMGKTVEAMIHASKESHQRINQRIQVSAFTNYTEQEEIVAEFTVELSIKVRLNT